MKRTEIKRKIDAMDGSFKHVDSAIEQCNKELSDLDAKLADIRKRQKESFGDLLLRTTLNRPLNELLHKERQTDT